MSTDAIQVQVASDGTRKVFRTGAESEGPRPIDDKELEAVAGGAIGWVVTFTDGCEWTIDAYDAESAWDLARVAHANKGHTNHDATISAV